MVLLNPPLRSLKCLANPEFWGQWLVVSKLRWPNFQLILCLQRLKTAAVTPSAQHLLKINVVFYLEICVWMLSFTAEIPDACCNVHLLLCFHSVCYFTPPSQNIGLSLWLWSLPPIHLSYHWQIYSSSTLLPCQPSAPNSTMAPQCLLD